MRVPFNFARDDGVRPARCGAKPGLGTGAHGDLITVGSSIARSATRGCRSPTRAAGPTGASIWHEREVSERPLADPDRGRRRGAAHRRRSRHRGGDGLVAPECAVDHRRVPRAREPAGTLGVGSGDARAALIDQRRRDCSSRASTWATSSATASRSRRPTARPTPAAAVRFAAVPAAARRRARQQPRAARLTPAAARACQRATCRIASRAVELSLPPHRQELPWTASRAASTPSPASTACS